MEPDESKEYCGEKMFDETLRKFVLVIGLFVVFVILGNLFAASHHAAARRAASIRRRGRRRRLEPQRDGDSPAGEGSAGGADGASGLEEKKGTSEASSTSVERAPSPLTPSHSSEEDEVDLPSLKRKLLPQLAFSAVALVVAALALYVMWQVAESG